MKIFRLTFDLRSFLVGLSIVSIIAGLIRYFTGFSFWASFGLIFAAMLVTGLVAQAEDDTPGGFNSPLPQEEEKMKQPPRSFWGQFCMLLSILTFLPLLSIAYTYAGPAAFAEQSYREFVHMQLAWSTIPLSLGLTGAYLILTQKRKT